MFLSLAQIGLIDMLAHIEQKMDILDCNIATASALAVRGITQINIAKAVGDISTVTLTDTGFSIADHLSFYANPPKYADIRYKTSKVKQKRKKWVNKHKKVT